MNPFGGQRRKSALIPADIGVRKPQAAVGSRGSFGVTGNGMMTFRSKRKVLHGLSSPPRWAMAVVVGSAGTGAYAADDGEDELLDVKIFRGLLKGLGLRKDEAAIDYRERSPLVVPPSKELPPPDTDCCSESQDGRMAGRSRRQAGQAAQGRRTQAQAVHRRHR